MPQRVVRHAPLVDFQREATKALTALRQEISQRERELAALKTEAARWQSLLHGSAPRARATVRSPRVPPGRRRRLKWSAVLQALPPQFTTKDVAQTAKKPIAQVYTHVSGWMKDKKVRKVSDGYQKMSGVS
jgi:hypothetical protein